MALDSLISKYAYQTVTVEHMTTAWDAEGNQITATSSAHTAIIQRTQKLIRAKDGTEKVSSCQIILHSTYAIGYDDKITLPTGEQPLILAIESPVDFAGNTAYWRVFT